MNWVSKEKKQRGICVCICMWMHFYIHMLVSRYLVVVVRIEVKDIKFRWEVSEINQVETLFVLVSIWEERILDDSRIAFLSDWLNISHIIRSDRGYRWRSRFVFCSVLFWRGGQRKALETVKNRRGYQRLKWSSNRITLIEKTSPTQLAKYEHRLGT